MSIRTDEPKALPQSDNASSIENISVVIPCYNEERFIDKVLNNLADQYDSKHYEIIIVEGMSNDRTREVIASFCHQRPDLNIRVLDNPDRQIPKALNLGIAAAQGEIIARMDAHAVASPGYIRRCADVLRKTGAGVVGMPCRVCPGDETLLAQAIALGVSNKFGIGDAKYRLQDDSESDESVDTVAFGFFRKAIWQQIGGFNEELLTNEDYDFNYRVRHIGKEVILGRTEHCDYFARNTLKGLAKQYWRYGSWKARMVLLNPQSIKLRHLVAPVFVISMLIWVIIALFFPLAWFLLAGEIACYLMVSLRFSYQIARDAKRGIGLFVLMPLVFLTIHWTWGSGFLIGLIRPPR